MIDAKPYLLKDQRATNGFRQEITFDANSSNNCTIYINAKTKVSTFETENIASWSIAVNGNAGVITSANNIKVYQAATGDFFAISIVRVNSALPAKFTIGSKTFDQATTQMRLVDWANNKGGDGRYFYILKNNDTLLCIDTNLTKVTNLKAITAVVNNGTTLTLTCNGHGFSNGNVVSLVDVGGFTADVNHKPFTLTNVTTNTFDVTTTVTGTWDNIGYLAGAWVTTPQIASISLPAGVTWTTMAYRSIDKTLYLFGNGGGGSQTASACTVDADGASGGFNTVKNWDKTVSNAATAYGITSNTVPECVVYDAVRDRLYMTASGGSYYLTFGTSVPVKNTIGALRTSNILASIYAYDSQCIIFGVSTFFMAYSPFLSGLGNVSGVNYSGFVYSQAQGAFYLKTNSATSYQKKSADSSFTTIVTGSTLTGNWTSSGCAIDSLTKLYFTRASSTFSFGSTVDVSVWDYNTSVREDIYIPTPSAAATILGKTIYCYYGGKVLVRDNGTNNRIHIFDSARASGKKYIGYFDMTGVCTDCLVNNLMGL